MTRLFVGAILLALLWPAFVHAGSGVDRRTQECKALLVDHYVIASSRMEGMTQENLTEHARTSPKLPDERRPKALELIVEAYAAEDVKAWFQGYWFACMGTKPLPESTTLLPVKSQKFYCDHIAAIARSMEWDFRNTEIRPEHYVNQHALAQTVDRCMKAGEKVRDCVVSWCMGQTT